MLVDWKMPGCDSFALANPVLADDSIQAAPTMILVTA